MVFTIYTGFGATHVFRYPLGVLEPISPANEGATVGTKMKTQSLWDEAILHSVLARKPENGPRTIISELFM